VLSSRNWWIRGAATAVGLSMGPQLPVFGPEIATATKRSLSPPLRSMKSCWYSITGVSLPGPRIASHISGTSLTDWSSSSVIMIMTRSASSRMKPAL